MKKILTILAIIFFCTAAAASEPFAKSEQASVELISGGYDANGDINLGLHYKLSPGWHIYWRTPGDNGYPMNLDWSAAENIETPAISWPAPSRTRIKITDDLYSESYNYQDEVVFPISVRAKNPAAEANIKLHLNYAVCREICIPVEADLSLTIPTDYKNVESAKLIEHFKALLPKENGSFGMNIGQVSLGKNHDGSQFLIINASSQKTLKNAEIFVESDELAFYNPSAVFDNNTASFELPITFLSEDKNLSGKNFIITLKNGEEAIEKSISFSDITPSSNNAIPPPIHSYSLEIILLFALLGGLILNVMPCVLPVLSIKLLSVIKHGGSTKAQIAASFIITAIGIIFSFIALAALIIGLKSIGMNVGWGFHFQEPLFIITMVVLLTLFAANMWGFFEFRMPAIGGSALQKSFEHSLTGYFLTGVFATILATPCTAPFLGTAVGFALARGNLEILLIFAFMGIGMALPYLFFSIFPALICKLPKPGNWMVKIKIILGWMLAASAIWFIWVLSNQIGQFAALILLSLVTIKIIKLWAANHIEFLARKPVKYTVLLAITAMAFILPIHVSDNSHKVSVSNMWQSFDEKNINILVKQGKVVFVDVTADWCLTCKVNKFTVLDSADIHAMFAKENLVAMQADWTNKSDDIYNYIKKYNRVGIPFNIVYGPNAPEGIILSELLSKKEVLEAVAKAK